VDQSAFAGPAIDGGDSAGDTGRRREADVPNPGQERRFTAQT